MSSGKLSRRQRTRQEGHAIWYRWGHDGSLGGSFSCKGNGEGELCRISPSCSVLLPSNPSLVLPLLLPSHSSFCPPLFILIASSAGH